MTGPTIEPALWCDHGYWQVVRDETELYAPTRRFSLLKCRLWCLLHGYGWLPVESAGQ